MRNHNLSLWFFLTCLVQTTWSLRRSLSHELFLSYEPVTSVFDHAAIDMDYNNMLVSLERMTDTDFEQAFGIYTKGGNSRPYAELSLDPVLDYPIPSGASVVGKTSEGWEVLGKVMNYVPSGHTLIRVLYSESLTHDFLCQVGSNPLPNTEGCFAMVGEIDIDDTVGIVYTYLPSRDNHNDRTLQKFSLEAQALMGRCGSRCPYDHYVMYFKYYGMSDYADNWITAAFEKKSTSYPTGRGNADFSTMSHKGLEKAIMGGTLILSVWMKVVGQMEHSIDECVKRLNGGANYVSNEWIRAWDQAVAYYVGSEAKATYGEFGYFLYSLADTMCQYMSTCGEDSTAQVNKEIMLLFAKGKKQLLLQDCSGLVQSKDEIVRLMMVPLIQGTLVYTHELTVLRSEEHVASAATFAAAVAPLVYNCSIQDAGMLQEQLGLSSGTTSFVDVKAALERQYKCMGVFCGEIGGLVDKYGEYLPNAVPCNHHTVQMSDGKKEKEPWKKKNGNNSSSPLGLTAAIFIGVACLVASFGLLFIARKFVSTTDEKQYDGMEGEPDAPSSRVVEEGKVSNIELNAIS